MKSDILRDGAALWKHHPGYHVFLWRSTDPNNRSAVSLMPLLDRVQPDRLVHY